MLNRNMLLAQAKQERTCPPLSIRRAEAHQKDMAHHKRLCPSCAMADTEALEAADELMQGVVDILRPSFQSAGVQSAGQPVKPGQLRPIRPDLGCWWEGYYYNPPLVLVLENTHAISNDLQAAQVYDETGLAGPGDLILTASQTGLEKLFIQPWNTYTLKADQLGPTIGRVSPEILQTILRMVDDPDFIPEWAPVTFPFRDHDPRLYFREIETEVGYVFSSRAAALLLAEHERPLLRLVDGSADAVQESVRHLKPNIIWLRRPDTPEEALAFAQKPSEEMAMAAGGSEIEGVSGNLFLFNKGRMEIFDTLQVRVHGWRELDAGVEITGRTSDLPSVLAGSFVLGFLYCEEAGVQGPGLANWNAAERRFRIIFPDVPAGARCELNLAVVGELA
jgi:hypothetical protein